jgi:oligopeptide transport system substrate-binding protein
VVLARRLITWTALSVLTMGTAACGLFGGSADEPPAGTVTLSIGEPAHLLPSDVSDPSGAQVLSALFTPLVTYNAQREPVEAAAQSIKSTDNRGWTIILAEGYTFHNGEKVTAQSYLDAWNYASYGPHKQRNSYLFERIDGFAEMQGDQPAATELAGLKKTGDLVFTVTLSAPFIDFPSMLGHPAFSPLPTAAFASPGVLVPGFENTVIGQGPFRMAGPWEHDKQIDVRRYDAAIAPAKVDAVRFKIYGDLGEAYDDVTEEQLDIVTGIPATKLPDATKTLGDRLRTTPGSSLTMLAFPSFQRDFEQPAVRRAISMAIDRDQIVNSLFAGSQLPARSFVPPLVAGYRADACGVGCTYDPAAAKVAYAEAKGPATLKISYNSDGGHQAWVDATCAQLTANLGVTCTGTPEPTFETMLGKVRATQPVGLFRMTWFLDYPSKESYLGPLFTSDGSSNFEAYRNPDLDAAVRSGMAAGTASAALADYRRAETILARDMPVIPLRFAQNTVGHSKRVSAVTVDIFDRIDLSAVELS